MGGKRGEVMKEVVLLLVAVFVSVNLVSAGVGIFHDVEGLRLNEGESGCLNYAVFNPYEEEANVEISVSEGVKEYLVSQEADSKLVPANTASADALPVEFCFEVPKGVYDESCFLGFLFCKQSCDPENPVTYSGEIEMLEDSGDAGSTGSATGISVTAPFSLEVICDSSSGSTYSFFVITAVILGVLIVMMVFSRMKRVKLRQK
jgi:hypothetical protein